MLSCCLDSPTWKQQSSCGDVLSRCLGSPTLRQPPRRGCKQHLLGVIAAKAEGGFNARRALGRVKLSQVVPRAELVAPPALAHVVAVRGHLRQRRRTHAAGQHLCSSTPALSSQRLVSVFWGPAFQCLNVDRALVRRTSERRRA